MAAILSRPQCGKTRSVGSALRHAEATAKPCIDYPLRTATSYSITYHEIKCFHVRITNFRWIFRAPCVCYHPINRMRCWCSRRFDDYYCSKYYMCECANCENAWRVYISYGPQYFTSTGTHNTLAIISSCEAKPPVSVYFAHEWMVTRNFDVSLTPALTTS